MIRSALIITAMLTASASSAASPESQDAGGTAMRSFRATVHDRRIPVIEAGSQRRLLKLTPAAG